MLKKGRLPGSCPLKKLRKMKSNVVQYEPTPDQPLLIGLLVDVSGSMRSSIQNRRGKSLNRLESFRDALDDLISRAKEMSRVDSSEKIAPLIKIFAYGFGFGNPLSLLFGGKGGPVRDLLDIPGEPSSTVSIDKLANSWMYYRRHVESMAIEMFGSTPMGDGFKTVLARFGHELRYSKFAGQPVLFVLSDGDPTDASSEQIVEIAKQLRQIGVLIVSCYVTDDDIAEPRHIYGVAPGDWPKGAKLMFESASLVPPTSSFDSYLREYSWTIESKGRFFTQVNQSEILSEFMNAILSPLDDKRDAMLETVAIPILLKAVDFIFGEGSKILEERRKRLNESDSGVSLGGGNDRIQTKIGVIQTRDEALRTKIEQAKWTNSETKVSNLMSLLEIHTKNYYLAKEKLARFGRDFAPPIVIHQIEEAEGEIAAVSEQLQEALSDVYGKKVDAPLN